MTNNTAQRPIWTVLVYMVADSGDSFYQFAMQDVTEMMKAPFDDRVRVVVHANAPSPWQKKCWEVTGASDVTGGGGAKVKMGTAKEIPCHDKNLLDFVQNVVDNYESEYYLLVLWGHGEGIDWKENLLAGRSSVSTIKGAGKRFAPGSQNAIEVGELGKSLAELRLEKVKSEKVVVGFDACLMGMVEVFDEIQPYVGWVVAAADEIPDTGWPYTDVLKLLGDRPDTRPKELAERIVDTCAKWYSHRKPDTGDITDSDDGSDAKVSFAACDLSHSRALLESMRDLTTALRACVPDTSVRKAVKEARDFAEDLAEKAYVDLYSFCSELVRRTERQELRNAASGVMYVLNDLIAAFQFSSSYPQKYSKDARAVSICFPESAELVGSIPNLQVNWGSYIDLTFNRTTHWTCFLTEFWDRERVEGDRRKPKALAKAAGC
jgi:Clostripain family